MRVFNATRTISSVRDISHSDIQTVQTDTPALAAERADYLALTKFQLFANQEQPVDWYAQWTAAFKKFLSDYPHSDKTKIIQQNIEACQAERRHVENGEVKFADQWMTPDKKTPLVKQQAIELLKSKIANLQTQRDQMSEVLGATEGALAGTEQALKAPQNRVKAPGLEADVINYQTKLGKDRVRMASLDAKINDLQSQVSKLEQEYQAALSKLNEPKQAIVEMTPPPSPKPEPSLRGR